MRKSLEEMSQWFGKRGLRQGPSLGREGSQPEAAPWGGAGLSLWCHNGAPSLTPHISLDPDLERGSSGQALLFLRYQIDPQYGRGC